MNEISSEQIATVIQAAINHHKSIKAKVDFNKNDKIHALYIVLGGVLSMTCTAHALNQQGIKMSLYPLRRLLNEAVELVLFIEELSSDSRQLKAWFNGKIIERNIKKNDQYKRIEAEVFTEEQIAAKDKESKNFNDLLSKFAHPSITLLRTTMSRSSNDFDYFNEHGNPVLTSRDFANFFLIPCLYALLLPIKTLPMSNERYDILRSLMLSLE